MATTKYPPILPEGTKVKKGSTSVPVKHIGKFEHRDKKYRVYTPIGLTLSAWAVWFYVGSNKPQWAYDPNGEFRKNVSIAWSKGKRAFKYPVSKR